MVNKQTKTWIVLGAMVILIAIAGIAISAQKSTDGTGANSRKSDSCRVFTGIDTEQCTNDYIGLGRDEAVQRAIRNNLLPKITMIDGEEQINTDEGGNIILLEVEDGSITKAYFEDDLSKTDVELD